MSVKNEAEADALEGMDDYVPVKGGRASARSSAPAAAKVKPVEMPVSPLLSGPGAITVAEDRQDLPVVVSPRSAGEADLIASDEPNVFILGMPDVDYHSRPEISASGLKVFATSPKAFQAGRRVTRQQQATFDVGHVVHSIVLGTGAPIVTYPTGILSVDGAVRTKAAQDMKREAEAAGKVIVKPDVFVQLREQAEAVLRHPKAGPLLAALGESEVSGFATDPETGLRMRMRADRISDATIFDVKTTTDLSTSAIMRAVVNLGYDVSGEVYRYVFELVTGVVPEPVTLIFTEKSPPYDVRVVQLGEDWMEGGWSRFRELLLRYAECVEKNEWPGVDESGPVEALPAPAWYARRNAAEEGAWT